MCAASHVPAGRAGTLVLRVWLEDDADPHLRVRLLGSLNLNENESNTAVAASIDETLAYVRHWLERFLAVDTA